MIAAAATPLLAPLGCRQKGHSLVWIGDRRFWLVHVEFAPRSAGGPSQLYVGAYWLWYVQSSLGFDYGTRFADFPAYRDDAQFAPAARDMAARAAAEIEAMRAKFAAVSDIARHLAATGGDGMWPLYHAAVATALAGDIGTAQDFFRRLGAKPARRDWEARLQADAGALAGHLPDVAAFRAAASAVINRQRALQGLAPDSGSFG